MVIVETQIFTRRVQALLTDEEYRDFQSLLIEHPDIGAVIPGTGGLRKVRWSGKGHGKRGGVRSIYYWAVKRDQILLLLIYAKNEQDNLSASQKKVLKQIVEDEYNG